MRETGILADGGNFWSIGTVKFLMIVPERVQVFLFWLRAIWGGPEISVCNLSHNQLQGALARILVPFSGEKKAPVLVVRAE